MTPRIAAISYRMQNPPHDPPRPDPAPPANGPSGDNGQFSDNGPATSNGLALGEVITVPDLHAAPVFYPSGTRLIWISEAGEISDIRRETAATRLQSGVVVLCHRRWSEARANTEIKVCLDVMELFAFCKAGPFLSADTARACGPAWPCGAAIG